MLGNAFFKGLSLKVVSWNAASIHYKNCCVECVECKREKWGKLLNRTIYIPQQKFFLLFPSNSQDKEDLDWVKFSNWWFRRLRKWCCDAKPLETKFFLETRKRFFNFNFVSFVYNFFCCLLVLQSHSNLRVYVYHAVVDEKGGSKKKVSHELKNVPLEDDFRVSLVPPKTFFSPSAFFDYFSFRLKRFAIIQRVKWFTAEMATRLKWVNRKRPENILIQKDEWSKRIIIICVKTFP